MFSNPNDEEEADSPKFGGRLGVIYVIDAHPDMFANECDTISSKFRMSFECIEKSMMNTIINSKKDMTGIVFYNTRNNVKPQNTIQTDDDETDLDLKFDIPKHVSVFMDLESATKEAIQKINSFRMHSEFIDFDAVYGSCDQLAEFGNVLWLCSKLFALSRYKLQTKQIVLFTCNDHPHEKNSEEFRKALVRANDLKQQKIDMTIVPMKDGFDGEYFYHELICIVTDQDPETFIFPESKQSIDMYMTRIYRKDVQKTCTRHLIMHIGGDVMLSVSLYSMSRRTDYPKRVTLLRENNEIIKTRRIYALEMFDTETKPNIFLIEPKEATSEIRKFIDIGGEKVSFTNDEIGRMKSLMEPGLRLLGFKPLTNISIHWHLDPVGYLFYDDKIIKGSSKLYRALWEKCLEKEKFAICILTLRQKTPPKYVALIPQKMKTSLNGTTIRHDGFRIFTIPSDVQIRNINLFSNNAQLISPEVEQIEIFEKVIKKLRLRYEPENFQNPKARELYSRIEALAFDIVHDNEDSEDSTLPPIEKQDDVVQPFMETITSLFGEISIGAKKAKKRNTDNPAHGTWENKQLKTEGGLNQLNTDAILNAISNGSIIKFSVPQLKTYFHGKGISGYSKWTKDVLIKKITEHLGD